MVANKIENQEQFLTGGGEMGQLIRSINWSENALGPIENWPQSLRTTVSLCLSSTFPILIAWGPENIQIYNDSYRPICGSKHPEAMGQNFKICWETALPVVGSAFDLGQQGEGTYIKDQRMFLDRYGYLEEAFMTFSFAPIRDESGEVGGIFHPITESTENMLSARRTQVLIDLGTAIGKAKSLEQIGIITAEKYADGVLDLPFMLFYKLDKATNTIILISAAGLPTNTELTPQLINLNQKNISIFPFETVLQTEKYLVVNNIEKYFGNYNCAPYPNNPNTAVIVPLYISGQTEVFGFIVAGVSARRTLDKEYMNFYDLLGTSYNTAISNVYAFEQEQKRAAALAEIDRAKTAFFSNVSHEFRTPLTLILGPLEELLLRQDSLQSAIKDPIESIHRNAIRLLKLVNNLLDFSRVEAGRTKAVYQQVNLGELTTDLASSFRSVIEKANMQLVVTCKPIEDIIFVDPGMWEKIVLNLLSNAFKYTLEGCIHITIEKQKNNAILKVTDTGVGIPENELPHMFERFHRIENSLGRSHEGSGIGLSLINELVQLHHGKIYIESTIGKGSTFTVEIPLGHKHLPPEQIIKDRNFISSPANKDAFIKEALLLLNDEKDKEDKNLFSDNLINETLNKVKDATILIVDDNADMRDYLTRLLLPYFKTFTAKNGKEALDKITLIKPDLVLSDIMMPIMDGREMLKNIKGSLETAKIPVVFLSARADSETRIDGLESGADDYLVKPFSAEELLIKIRGLIKVNKARIYTELQLRNLFNGAPVAIAFFRGPKHTIEIMNNLMLNYCGRSTADTINFPLFEVIPELVEQGYQTVFDNIFTTGQRYLSEETPINLLRFGKEETLYIKLTIEPFYEDNRNISGMMATVIDLTEEVLARKKLEKVMDTLQLAINSTNMGIWSASLITDTLTVSENGKKIHGISPTAELPFTEAFKMVAKEHMQMVNDAILNAMQTKSGFDVEYIIYPLDGSLPKWVKSMGKAYYDKYDNPLYIAGTLLDITELKQDAQRKNDFIGMVSHELKTPLTSLKAFIQLLQVKANKEQDIFSMNALDKAHNQVKKMHELIKGFLDVSMFEAGKIKLNIKTFNLSDLIQETLDEAVYTMNSHNIYFDKKEDCIIVADKDKIGQVINNFLTNAIKYSSKGKDIQIICTKINGMAEVSVKDEGIGIKQEHLNKIFDRYYRVDSTHNKTISGFGIGLYLCAEIIKSHHGKIWVESKMGIGSTFNFSLPL